MVRLNRRQRKRQHNAIRRGARAWRLLAAYCIMPACGPPFLGRFAADTLRIPLDSTNLLRWRKPAAAAVHNYVPRKHLVRQRIFHRLVSVYQTRAAPATLYAPSAYLLPTSPLFFALFNAYLP